MAFTGSNNGGCKLLVATVLAFGMLTTASLAHTAEQEQMCASDAMRLCSSEIPDVDRVTVCMIRNKSQLSPGCRVFFGPSEDERAASPVDLRPVTTRKPGHGRIHRSKKAKADAT